jgi:Carboxypeptidase regulatory-like domain
MKRFFLAATLAVISCWAQNTGEITGRIVDASGSVAPNANIEIQSLDTNVRWTMHSNSDGYYTQALLPPGDYKVIVSLTGFKQEIRTIKLEVQQISRLDFTLQVGTATETIEVTAATPMLESGNASVGQVIETQAISDLPLNGRNYLDLAKLSIGVTEPSGNDQDGTAGDRAKNGGSFVANGTRSDMNNFILDGIDNNAKIVDQSNNTNVVIQPSVDALMEFKVETNVYSAEYGHSAGAVVNATIRSGTNKLHGTVFEFIRNDKVDARNFYLPSTDPTPELRRNQYGATLGGPIKKNKTFIFGSWQGTRQNSGAGTIVETLESDAFRHGNFTSLAGNINDPALTVPNPTGTGFVKTPFPGKIIPESRISPTTKLLYTLLPLPKTSAAANNYVASPLTMLNRDQWDVRGDENFSNADKLFVRYSYYTYHFVNPGPLPAPVVGSTNFQQSINDQSGHGVVLGETHLFGASFVNDFRAGYNRVSNALAPFVSDNLLPQYGFGYIPPSSGLTGLPTITRTGYSQLGEAGFLPDAKGSDTFQLNDSISWNKGTHFVRAGVEYRWVRSRYHIWGNARGTFAFSGAFTGNAIADFLLGDPNTAALTSVFIGDLRYKYYGGYVNDDWKVTPRLTLNLGLRYEYITPPFERNNQQSNFVIGPNKLIYVDNKVPPSTPASLAMNVPSNIDNRGLVETHSNNWAPRAGMAYQLFRNTVIRVGGGIFYAEASALGASGRPTANPPFRTTFNYTSDAVHPTLTFATGFPTNATDPTRFDPSTSALISFNPSMATPAVYHWSFSLQQQVHKFLIDTNYVGTKGTHLSVQYDIDQAFPGPSAVATRRPFPGFNTINFTDSMGNSEYNSLQFRVQRRYSNGISLLASFTWSKSIDLGSGGLVGDLAVRNVLNVGWERGDSSASVPRRLVLSYTYALPFGARQRYRIGNPVAAAVLGDWQLNGITTVRDGHPFSVTLNNSTANTGTPRPDRVAGKSGALPKDQRSINNWFDTTAFTRPTQYNYGNAGRDIVWGPGAVNFDFSMFKRYRLRKEGNSEVQLRFEGFNVFNHPQFGRPNANLDNVQVGTITFLTTTMRQLQAGLKVMF